MIIEKRIKLNNIDYLIGIEVKYDDNNFLVKKDGSYFDSGDLSYLIEDIEKKYKLYNYYEENGFINDIAFIYDCFPFLSYIKDIYYDKSGHITTSSIIYKEDILKLIEKNNIKMGLFEGKQSVCPSLFEEI